MQRTTLDADTKTYLMKELSITRDITERVTNRLLSHYNDLERMILDFQTRIEDKIYEDDA